jgi:hypothetical protein
MLQLSRRLFAAAQQLLHLEPCKNLSPPLKQLRCL